MISPQLGKAAFTWAILLILLAGGLLLVLTPGSREFAITVATLVVGVLFLGLVVVLVKVLSR